MIERRKFLAIITGLIASVGTVLPGRKAKPAPFGKLYASAGEVTTCENGHPLAIFTRDVFVMGMSSSDDWQFVGGADVGMTHCPTCRGRVMAGRGLYYFDGKPRVIDHA